MKVVFWAAVALILYTHAGYPMLLWVLSRLTRRSPQPTARSPQSVSLIIAAYDEEAVIARKVRNALAVDYPRELLEIIVPSDGSPDRTVAEAEAAGADLVLDLPR